MQRRASVAAGQASTRARLGAFAFQEIVECPALDDPGTVEFMVASAQAECQAQCADVIEAALGHQDEDEIRRAYNRAKYWPERVKLMQNWADRCCSL